MVESSSLTIHAQSISSSSQPHDDHVWHSVPISCLQSSDKVGSLILHAKQRLLLAPDVSIEHIAWEGGVNEQPAA
jgi:hypothetical protein